MEDSRTFLLDGNVVKELLGLVEADYVPKLEEVRRLVPPALTSQEVKDIGLQVTKTAEHEATSWDGVSDGHKAERKVLGLIGSVAVVMGDYKTAESVIGHFKRCSKERLSIVDLTNAVSLSHELCAHTR